MRPLLYMIFAIPLLFMLYPNHAEAATYNKFISITLSDTCQMTHCVAVKDLIKYDNSTQAISGRFVNHDGDYVRLDGYKNSANWYSANEPGKTIIFVDPDKYTILRSRQIEITSTLREFVPPTNLTKSELDFHTTKYVTYSGVYVDPLCQSAKVGIKEYPDIVKVIEHMGSGCKTDLENKIIHVEKKTQLNYCGNECQWQKYLKQALIDSKKKLLK